MESNNEILRELSTDYIIVKLRNDGIVITEEVANCPNDSNIQIAQEIMDAVKEICQDQTLPLMSRLGSRQPNKEERRYYMKQNTMPVSKVAMIIKTPFQRLIANFLIGINKVPYETRLFTEEEKAVEWLKS